MAELITEAIYSDYLSNLLRGDSSACAETVRRLMDENLEVRELYTGLFQRSMYEVGELWETGRISVATEHLATSITESLMPLVYPAIFAREHLPRSAIVSCVADEYHQMGGRMVADILELNRWHGHFLGANTPLPDLQTMIDEKKPDLLALSVSIYFNMPNLTRAVEAVREVHPSLPIVVGGQAFRWGGEDIVRQHERVELIRSLAELEEYIAIRQGKDRQ